MTTFTHFGFFPVPAAAQPSAGVAVPAPANYTPTKLAALGTMKLNPLPTTGIPMVDLALAQGRDAYLKALAVEGAVKAFRKDTNEKTGPRALAQKFVAAFNRGACPGGAEHARLLKIAEAALFPVPEEGDKAVIKLAQDRRAAQWKVYKQRLCTYMMREWNDKLESGAVEDPAGAFTIKEPTKESTLHRAKAVIAAQVVALRQQEAPSAADLKLAAALAELTTEALIRAASKAFDASPAGKALAKRAAAAAEDAENPAVTSKRSAAKPALL